VPVIKVSFLRDKSYNSHTRHVSLPHMVSDRLHMVICQMMQAGELFACYHLPGGGSVALDKQGVSIQI
jgi:hypothetical protein